MGTCLSVKSKNPKLSQRQAKAARNKIPKPIRKISELPIENCQEKSRIDLTRPLQDAMEIFYKFESSESFENQEDFLEPSAPIQRDKGHSSQSSLVPDTGKKRVNFAKIKEKNRMSKKNNDFSEATSATKSSSIALSNQAAELVKSYSELLPFEKKEESDSEIIITSINDQPFNNFGSNCDFINKLFLNSFKKRATEETFKKRGPRRLTQYSSFKDTSPRPALSVYPNIKLDFSSVAENTDEQLLSFSVLSMSQQEVSMKGAEVFIKSLASNGIESLDLKTDGSFVHIFSVPYSKNVSEFFDYNKRTVRVHEFECFYKNANLNFLEKEESLTLQLFPSRWENGIIPYFIEKSLVFIINSKNESLNNIIVKAIQVISTSTVVKFVAYSPEKHKDYINFSFGTSNKSFLGCHNGRNNITLNHRADLGVVLHEIMHSLGFMHEYQKNSKEKFYYLSKNQLKSQSNLEDHLNICISGLDFGPFDASSIIHYRSCDHMICFKDFLDSDEVCLSPLDISKINLFYQFGRPELEISEKLNELKRF